eukprot:GFKZ01013129.1.p1 GENE.GFKZ01013129.1~~GFKZ01013129.1.p1  ORF type:complete len:393 (-),score=71.89 GFKZ01013129.1:2213-3391(-)
MAELAFERSFRGTEKPRELGCNEAGTEQINVYATGRSTPCALIFNCDDVFTTRKRYRIVGDFVGTLPKHTSQNQYLSLPLALSYEETSYGVRQGFFRLVDDRPGYYGGKDGVETFFEKRRGDVEEQVNAALEGYRREREKRGLKRKRDDRHGNQGDSGTQASQSGEPVASGRDAETDEPVAKKRREGLLGWLGSALRGMAEMVAATWKAREAAVSEAATREEREDVASREKNEVGKGAEETQDADKERMLEVRQRRQARQTALIVTAMSSREDEREKEEREVGLEALVRPVGMGDDRLRWRQLVYDELQRKGYHVSCGAKFGADFLAYAGDPVLFHAALAVVVMGAKEDIESLDLVALGRLGNATRKKVVFAYVVDGRKVQFLGIQWEVTLP